MYLSTYKSKQCNVMHNMASTLVEAVNDSAANAMFHKPSTLAKSLKNSHMLTHTKSCDIKLVVKPAQKLVDFARELGEDLKKHNKNYPKTVFFCNTYNDCSYLYTTIVHYLGKQKTTPPGFPN